MSDPTVQFSDNDKTRAQESPSSNQGESPRATGSDNAANNPRFTTDVAAEADRREFEAWKAQRGNEKPEETASYSPTAPSGRKVAPSEPSKSEVRTQEVPEEENPQSYVWLANGEVLLVNNEDLPSHAGRGAEYGYWEKDGKVFSIVAVHPREITIQESK